MQRIRVVETDLQFRRPISVRRKTTGFTLHWQGVLPLGYDLARVDADRINGWHIERPGWAGCGYHYILLTNGTIERGRPRWGQGAHDEGENAEKMGICVVYRDFPTMVQLEPLCGLLAELHEIYHLFPEPKTIKGHKDDEPPETPTECPGPGLYNMLPAIRQWTKELY